MHGQTFRQKVLINAVFLLLNNCKVLMNIFIIKSQVLYGLQDSLLSPFIRNLNLNVMFTSNALKLEITLLSAGLI